MDTTKLQNAITFLRANRNSFLATVAGDEPSVRAMWIVRVDDDGIIWYASELRTDKVDHVRANPRVCVTATKDRNAMRIFGTAEIVTDPTTIAELWEDSWTTYFTGKDDPNLALLKITPSRIEE